MVRFRRVPPLCTIWSERTNWGSPSSVWTLSAPVLEELSTYIRDCLLLGIDVSLGAGSEIVWFPFTPALLTVEGTPDITTTLPTVRRGKYHQPTCVHGIFIGLERSLSEKQTRRGQVTMVLFRQHHAHNPFQNIQRSPLDFAGRQALIEFGGRAVTSIQSDFIAITRHRLICLPTTV